MQRDEWTDSFKWKQYALKKKPWESKDPCIPNNEEDAWTHSATAAAVGCFLINLSSNE